MLMLLFLPAGLRTTEREKRITEIEQQANGTAFGNIKLRTSKQVLSEL